MSDKEVLAKEIAEQFVAGEGSANLRHFTEIEDSAAESLGKYEGSLFLDGLTELSDAEVEGEVDERRRVIVGARLIL